MLGAVLMKRDKDGKERPLCAEDVKPQTSDGYVGALGKLLEENGESSLSNLLGGFRIELISNLLARPKTYERLVSDLHSAGWTIKEAKELLDKGPC
jgi:hypothetical protein